MTGGLVSATVTVNIAFAGSDLLPTGSDAMQLTVVDGRAVVPIGNIVLGEGEHTTLLPAGGAPVAGSPVSIAVGGIKNTSAPHWLVASTEMLLGTVRIVEPV